MLPMYAHTQRILSNFLYGPKWGLYTGQLVTDIVCVNLPYMDTVDPWLASRDTIPSQLSRSTTCLEG